MPSPRLVGALAGLVLLGTAGLAQAQPRSLMLDSSRNNLQHAPGTPLLQQEALGRVRIEGSGARTMLLIPGIGFGDDVWDDFIAHYRDSARLVAVTLAGFGGTPAPPVPADGAFRSTPWSSMALRAMERVIDSLDLRSVTLVAHWGLATQLALRLAITRPDRIAHVVLVSGVLKAYYEQTPAMLSWSLEQRGRYVDAMAQRWFRFVTRTTWDDNNYMSYDYAVNPRRGLFLWRAAQAPSLTVWIRYLLEWYAMDPAPELARLRVPTLVVQPGLDDPAYYEEPGFPYVRNLTIDSWRDAMAASPNLRFIRISGARIFIMHDKPRELYEAIDRFLTSEGP